MSAHHAPVLLDSIALVSTLGEHSANTVIVSGSHGGVSAASFVVDHPYRPMIVFFNDAGIGKDSAGIAGLAMLGHRRGGLRLLACLSPHRRSG